MNFWSPLWETFLSVSRSWDVHQVEYLMKSKYFGEKPCFNNKDFSNIFHIRYTLSVFKFAQYHFCADLNSCTLNLRTPNRHIRVHLNLRTYLWIEITKIDKNRWIEAIFSKITDSYCSLIIPLLQSTPKMSKYL